MGIWLNTTVHVRLNSGSISYISFHGKDGKWSNYRLFPYIGLKQASGCSPAVSHPDTDQAFAAKLPRSDRIGHPEDAVDNTNAQPVSCEVL